MNMKFASCMLVFVLGLVPSVANGQLTQLEISGFTMGPIKYNVVVADYPDSVEPEELQSKVADSLERVNRLMSTYIPDSDVSRFNSNQSTQFQSVDAETLAVVNRAISISKRTAGAFDITVGPAVNLWSFGPDEANEKGLPSQQLIDNTKKLIGFEKLETRTEPPAIRKSEPGLKIDLSAIAKGYAVDQVAKVLDESGCKQFMVEVGGEVFARGERALGGKWRVGVERPNADRVANASLSSGAKQELASVAEISDRALATSGDYRNFFEFKGQRYSHTIDPTTCRPVEHGLATACIIADDCMTADALATAVMVLGVEKGQAVCQELGVECFLITRDSDFGMQLTEFKSDGFPLVPKSASVNPPVKPAGESNPQSILPMFIGATVVIGLAILGMAVGSIFGNKPVRGSCGGLANVTDENGDSSCGICAKPTTDCVERESSTVDSV